MASPVRCDTGTPTPLRLRSGPRRRRLEPIALGDSDVVSLRRALLGWGTVLRPLPWRETRDPWAVWVSETMLQQTQAARVAGPWASFLTRFPSPEACASAPVGEVVRRWAGLGYNRRALQLQRAAKLVVDEHGGEVPSDVAALKALPGVGPYTARAVAAFSYELPVGVVDTNVRRVLARAVAGRPLSPASSQELADSLVPEGRSWHWNQAIMELGATVCTARSPDCGVCPLARRCRWSCGGFDGPDPWRPLSRQSPFRGSDRQGRGRIVAALRLGPVAAVDIAAVAGWPDDVSRAQVIADRLVAEGMARRLDDGSLVLL